MEQANLVRPQASKSPHGSRLYCPFARHDFQRYRDLKRCNGAGFEDRPRLLAHLKKAHFPRGGKEDEPSTPRSSTTHDDPQEMLTEAQLKAITEIRRISPSNSIGAVWTQIYEIIFEEDKPVPFPFNPTREQILDTIHNPGPGFIHWVLERAARSGLTHATLGPDNLVSFVREAYLLVNSLFEETGGHFPLPTGDVSGLGLSTPVLRRDLSLDDTGSSMATLPSTSNEDDLQNENGPFEELGVSASEVYWQHWMEEHASEETPIE